MRVAPASDRAGAPGGVPRAGPFAREAACPLLVLKGGRSCALTGLVCLLRCLQLWVPPFRACLLPVGRRGKVRRGQLDSNELLYWANTSWRASATLTLSCGLDCGFLWAEPDSRRLKATAQRPAEVQPHRQHAEGRSLIQHHSNKFIWAYIGRQSTTDLIKLVRLSEPDKPQHLNSPTQLDTNHAPVRTHTSG
jgi:hypothetical protein